MSTKLLRAKTLCVFALLWPASVLQAQPVPGRDLLEFAIGSLAESPVLSLFSPSGTGNPATILLGPNVRGRVSVAGIDGPVEQGVSLQLVSLAIPLGTGLTGAASVLRAAVSGIPRTDGDPQSIGGDIPYGTTVASLALARSIGTKLDIGAAVRWVHGTLDDLSASSLHWDTGIVYRAGGKLDLRLAGSSFLFKPAGGSHDWRAARFGAAGDVRVLRASEILDVRGGYSLSSSASLGTDHYFYILNRVQMIDLNAGLLRSHVHGRITSRSRLGIGIRSGALSAGLAREENATGIAPTYQIALSSWLPR